MRGGWTSHFSIASLWSASWGPGGTQVRVQGLLSMTHQAGKKEKGAKWQLQLAPHLQLRGKCPKATKAPAGVVRADTSKLWQPWNPQPYQPCLWGYYVTLEEGGSFIHTQRARTHVQTFQLTSTRHYREHLQEDCSESEGPQPPRNSPFSPVKGTQSGG